MGLDGFHGFRPQLGLIIPVGFLRVNGQIRAQEMKNWCWASVTQLVGQVFGRNRRQCGIAIRHFKCRGKPFRKCCRRNYKKKLECNRIESIADALHCHGHFRGQRPFQGLATSVKLLRLELAARRPVSVRLDNGNKGHFVAITGITTSPPQRAVLEIQEPQGGYRWYRKATDLFGQRVNYNGWAAVTDLFLTGV